VRTDFLGDLRPMKKDKDDEYISTREAGKILGISLSSVARYFDKGILTGEKNPITNWRYVSRESLLALMKKHGMKVEDWD
jgi:predicted site-specific integrase-resolvase